MDRLIRIIFKRPDIPRSTDGTSKQDDEEDDGNVKYITEFGLPQHDQQDCPLFSKLPGEIRDRIFFFALSCYDNPAQLWDKNTT
jgi:hypothetical protein